MITAVIVENEKKHSSYLNTLLANNFPDVIVLKVCNNVPDAIIQLKATRPDLIFLDVKLPPQTGFDVLENIWPFDGQVIFTTGYDEFAARAFRFAALDFIRKPFGLEELTESIDRYKKTLLSPSKNIDVLLYNVKQADPKLQKVGIPVGRELVFLSLLEIIFCESNDNCTFFHLTLNRKIRATKTLKWVEDLLREHDFFRVHDSFLINLNHIRKYKKKKEGGMVELIDNKRVDVSRRKTDDFMQALVQRKMVFNA